MKHPRKDKKASWNDAETEPSVVRLLPHLARLALNIGFDSPHIRDLGQDDSEDLPRSEEVVHNLPTTPKRRRCGIPFVGQQASDQGSLFVSKMQISASQEDLTSLFVRQCFFQGFFDVVVGPDTPDQIPQEVSPPLSLIKPTNPTSRDQRLFPGITLEILALFQKA